MELTELQTNDANVVENASPSPKQAEGGVSSTFVKEEVVHPMHDGLLCRLPISTKMFISSFMCVIGLSYCALLGNIWVETEMSIPLIIEGYGDFEFMGLIDHTFRYLSWFVATFAITVLLFLFTRASEQLKRIFAAVVPVLILSDIGSAWLIRYNDLFAWQLALSGLMLALCFLTMFLRVQYDLWFPHSHKQG
ncbi:MAG: hypothetical protein ACI9CF_000939 [Candidatus Omnitrophota bacterium]